MITPRKQRIGLRSAATWSRLLLLVTFVILPFILISKGTIDRIMQATVIEDVIGEFVRLKRSGSSYKGLSPFSNEKTPSFYVVPSKGIYKDFSSGKGGSVIDFLMEHERMSYPEALRWLAGRYQIDIEEESTPNEQEIQQKTERDNLSIVSEFAGKWFQEQLHDTDEGKAIGLSYFEERGFREDTIRKFQLGYCPEGWDHMTRAALTAGYSQEYLLKAGLTRDRDGSLYDFFRGRVIFPIHNISGKVIAFAGRTLKADKQIAKYVNSPESELYHKSSVLFGMHLARHAMVKFDTCYLVEGYTDVISLHQAGIEQVVASSGTSLTEGQIRLIKRYTQNITILYDGDDAGIKASFRGIDMILQEGMNVRVVLFPDGDDPDSYARKHSSTEIQEFIAAHAQDFIRFKTSLLLRDAGEDPIRRAGLIKGIVESISLIPDAIQRSVFIRECSNLMQIGEDVLMQEMNKALRARFGKQAREELPVLDETPAPDGMPVQTDAIAELNFYHQEKELARLLITYGEERIVLTQRNEQDDEISQEWSIAEYLLHNLRVDEMVPETPVYARILREYEELMAGEAVRPLEEIMRSPDPDLNTAISDLIANRYILSENWLLRHSIYPTTEEMNLRKTANNCLLRLKLLHVMRMIDNVRVQLKQGSASEEEQDKLLSEQQELEQVKKQLAQYFRTVILR
ncbi:MAG: DNA primase [Flavobacteriales bacterium]